MTSPTKWAIACTGKISNDFAISLTLLPKEEHKIVAVASRSSEKATEFAAKYDVPKAYGTHEEMAKDDNIDVVYIGVVPSMLYSLSSLYLKAGQNVVCEAPFTLNTKQAKELVQLAKKNNVFLMEMCQALYCPAYFELLRQIREGSIGTPRLITIETGEDCRQWIESVGWSQMKEVGGLLCVAMCRYAIHLIRTIFGNDKAPKVIANAIYNEKDGIPDIVTVTLMYNNCMTTVNCATVKLNNNINVYGAGGPSGTSLKLNNIYYPTELACLKKDEMKKFPIPEYKTNYPSSKSFQYVAASVREYLVKGLKESPLLTFDHSIEISEMIDEVRKQIGLAYEVDKE